MEEVILKSYKDRIEKSLQDYTKKDRKVCIIIQSIFICVIIGVVSWPGQAVLAVDMMFWTSQAEEAMKKSGLAGLQQYYEKLDKQVL